MLISDSLLRTLDAILPRLVNGATPMDISNFGAVNPTRADLA
jgi:hypothetical protein